MLNEESCEDEETVVRIPLVVPLVVVQVALAVVPIQVGDVAIRRDRAYVSGNIQ